MTTDSKARRSHRRDNDGEAGSWKRRNDPFDAETDEEKIMDYISIGSTPFEEPCAQVGSDDYEKNSRIESKVFINQLLRVFGEPPTGVSIRVKTFPHDFGSYREVVVYYDDENQGAVDYAYNIEANTPSNWDSIALQELRKGEK